MSRSIDKHRETIARYLGRLAFLSEEEAAELEHAYKAIEDLQRYCHHSYKPVPIFTSATEECVYCGRKAD